MIKWTHEAVRAALSQAKAGRFSNMSAEEAMREILCAAANAQGLNDKPAVPAPMSAFDQFWSAYPCKKGKPVAEKAFKKVAGEFCAIMTGLEQYKRHKPDYADWMHPSTFLNQRRWEDEYDAPATGRTYNAQKDGIALLLQEATRREAYEPRKDQIAGNVVQLVSRSDMERRGDESEGGNLSVGAGPLF
jgi:hypothetical protein